MSETKQHKKNLGGGKGHKRTSGKESRGERHNREATGDFFDDLRSGEKVDGVMVGRVIKVFGGGRMSLMTQDGKEIQAALKGNLRCSKGAARHADNVTAVSPGCFVLVQSDEVLTQVFGVLNRKQVKELKEMASFPAVRGFFEEVGSADDGFEWDLEDGKAEGNTIEEGEEEVDIDAI
jgi:translation initiation factor IF-1